MLARRRSREVAAGSGLRLVDPADGDLATNGLVQAAVLVGIGAEQHAGLAGDRAVDPGVVLQRAGAGRLVAALVAVLEGAVTVVVVGTAVFGPAPSGSGQPLMVPTPKIS